MPTPSLRHLSPRFSLGGAAALALVLLASALFPLAAAAQFGFGPAGLLHTNGELDATTDAAPTIAADGTGNVVAIWGSSHDFTGTIGTDTDLLFVTSDDDGTTWKATAVLNSNAATDAGAEVAPHVAFAGTTCVVAWISTDSLGGTIGTDQDILFARSTDSGANWSAPAPIHANAATDGSVGDQAPFVATDGAGTWIVTWISTNDLGGTIGSDIDLLFVRSTDDGATWSAPAALNSNAATDSGGDNNPRLVHLGGGNWVASYASTDTLGGTVGSDTDIFSCRSTDGGATWIGPVVVNDFAAADSGGDLDVDPWIATDGAGNVAIAWSSLFSMGGTIGNDFDVLVSRSTDGGASWKPATVVNDWAGVDGVGEGDIIDHLACDGTNWIASITTNFAFAAGVGSDLDIALVRSTDDGENWSGAESLASYATSDATTDDEPALTPSSGTAWVAVWQSGFNLTGTSGTDGDLAFATSAFVPVELSGFALD